MLPDLQPGVDGMSVIHGSELTVVKHEADDKFLIGSHRQRVGGRHGRTSGTPQEYLES